MNPGRSPSPETTRLLNRHRTGLLAAAAIRTPAAAAGLRAVPAAQAATPDGAGCRHSYTSWGTPSQGQTGPEGRACKNGWWVEPDGQPY
ncbi:hypothetical protein [Streptomyces rimosus]|uniref:hypothetical protein n=1 Tax=Streptomyces rimosus TaxID=1927 RepID=UPI000A8B298F|nr:hypothetical protein [Streptomyces rimosus]